MKRNQDEQASSLLRSGGSSDERGSAMRKSRMQKLAIACIAAFAVLGGIEAADAQMHGGGGGSHGGGGFHDGGGFHGGGGFHDGGGFHGHGGFHGGGFHGHSHGSFFIGAPIIFGSGYYPYGYFDPYGYSYPYEQQDSGSNYWYCRDPAGYYPAVPTCPSGWLQVVPND
jgi:hypothetical protein